jgi:hypothetical protein
VKPLMASWNRYSMMTVIMYQVISRNSEFINKLTVQGLIKEPWFLS